MPTSPSKSKHFLFASLALVIILGILWVIFRTPSTDTTTGGGRTGKGFLGGIFDVVTQQGNQTGQGSQDFSTIPHGHGDDSEEERADYAGSGAPSPDQKTKSCNLMDTGIMDNDCDGIPNWLEERNTTDTENPNTPYKQGGWNHDRDALSHGMDGHYACDAYQNKLLNCEKNISSEIEAITEVQDTDKGGVADVMEIIKNMNPLDPCDDTNSCAGGNNGGLDENGNPIIGGGTGSNNNNPFGNDLNVVYDDRDPRAQIQLTLNSLLQELAINNALLDNFDREDVLTGQGPAGLSDVGNPIDLETLGQYQQGISEYEQGVASFVDTLIKWKELKWEDLPLAEVEAFRNELDMYMTGFMAFSQNLQLAIPPMIQAYEGWVNRQSVRIDIDLEQSSFREGKLRMYGFIDTNGFPNLPVQLRYNDITNQPFAQAYRQYCFARANLGFQQTDLGSGNNFLQDIFTILNSIGRYQSVDLEFAYTNPETGRVTYSNRASTVPGQRIPFTVSIDGLKVDGLYSFALVDPSIIIPIHLPFTILGQDLQLNTNIALPDPTNILSSFIFSGPSCFDYLNRFIPALTLDVDASQLVGGTETIPQRPVPLDTTLPAPTDGRVRNGTATLRGSIEINTAIKLSPTIPAGAGGIVRVPLYVRYGSPLLEQSTRTSMDITTTSSFFDVTQGFVFTIPNVHQEDWFAIYDAGTNAQILGPHQFKVLNEGLDPLSRFQERWYYVASYTPPARSPYYLTRQECVDAALATLGRPTICYRTALKWVNIDLAVPMGVEDTAFATAVAQLKETGKVGTQSLVGQENIYLTGTIDTKGNSVDLAVDAISTPYVTDENGIISYPQGQNKELILAGLDARTFEGGATPYTLPTTFMTAPGEKTTFEIPLSSVIATDIFKPGHLIVFTLQDKQDPKSIYYMGNVVTFLNSPAEVAGVEVGTTTLGVDAEMVVDIAQSELGFTPLNNDIEGDPNRLWNPLDILKIESLPQLVTHVFRVGMKLVLPLIGLAFVYLAVLFIVAGKNPQKQATAYNTLKMMGYGAGILFVAYILGLAMDSVIQCLTKGICF